MKAIHRFYQATMKGSPQGPSSWWENPSHAGKVYIYGEQLCADKKWEGLIQ